ETQAFFTKALRAEAHAVDTGRFPCLKFFGNDIVRIGLEGDLGIFRDFEKLSRLIDVGGDPFDRDQAWCAAAEVDRIEPRILCEFRSALIEFFGDRIEYAFHSGSIGAEM